MRHMGKKSHLVKWNIVRPIEATIFGSPMYDAVAPSLAQVWGEPVIKETVRLPLCPCLQSPEIHRESLGSVGLSLCFPACPFWIYVCCVSLCVFSCGLIPCWFFFLSPDHKNKKSSMITSNFRVVFKLRLVPLWKSLLLVEKCISSVRLVKGAGCW